MLDLRRIAGRGGLLLGRGQIGVGLVAQLQIACDLPRLVEQLLKPAVVGKIVGGFLNALQALLELRRVARRCGPLLFSD